MSKENNLKYLIKFILISVGLVAFVLIFGSFAKKMLGTVKNDTPLPTFDASDKITYVIDAGHGGEDAGASSNTGIKEKDLNLEIANILNALYVLNGNEVKMTRTEDTLLYDYYGDLQDYTGKKKVYDLKNRVKITNEYENPIYVGIHMNKFSKPQYSGTQVYYSKNDTYSSVLAKNVQQTVKLYLQPNNNRAIKKANSSIYVLDNLNCPAVLIECGFLSNEKETSLLCNDGYQAKLALSIFVATLVQDSK